MVLGDWLVLALLVGCQMAWMLRPFLGEPSLPFTFPRMRRGELNFYTAVLALARRLLQTGDWGDKRGIGERGVMAF